ncbi:MAG: PDZ domain-containing protein [Planctomycetes bacterium]|nr:PDZ domain-containing protein [Planctomycetota bacterium]
MKLRILLLAVASFFVVAESAQPQTRSLAQVSASFNAQMGLEITMVLDAGAAKKANLKAGDIITSVASIRTQTFEELQRALAAADSEVDLTFINASTKKADKTKITPKDGKIGVAVVPVNLP